MATVRVTALKDFVHHGEKVRRGDLVTMTPTEAAIAGRRAEVSLSPSVNAKSIEAEAARRAAPSPRRYRRRDMQAESE